MTSAMEVAMNNFKTMIKIEDVAAPLRGYTMRRKAYAEQAAAMAESMPQVKPTHFFMTKSLLGSVELDQVDMLKKKRQIKKKKKQKQKRKRARARVSSFMCDEKRPLSVYFFVLFFEHIQDQSKSSNVVSVASNRTHCVNKHTTTTCNTRVLTSITSKIRTEGKPLPVLWDSRSPEYIGILLPEKSCWH